MMEGSYTVEAAAILSLSLLIIMSAILLGFEVYGDTIGEVTVYEQADINAADTFRTIQSVKAIAGKKQGEKE